VRALLPAAPTLLPASPADVVLASFQRYLLDGRGLAPSTAGAYVRRADRFLGSCTAAADDLSLVGAGDVTRAVLAESANVSAGSAQYFVAALRSFLRFCQLQGWTSSDLSSAALTVTGRRRSTLPAGLCPAEATALLRSCDRRRTVGRRDYAVLLTMLRLGLRAGEVAALTLDDIDWRTGQALVHGKGSREDRLPLPVDVREAIAGYLRRGRPVTSRPQVFHGVPAPQPLLSRGSVSSIVRRACARAGVRPVGACPRAGVRPVGAHALRPTLRGVRAGALLPEIGQVLRHHSLSSTIIYARVDLMTSPPWPAGARAGRWRRGSAKIHKRTRRRLRGS